MPDSMHHWDEGVDFRFFASKAALKQQIVDTVNRGGADRILVVTGVMHFDEADAAKVPHHRFYLNKKCSLPWLCQVTATIRSTHDRAVLITNMPDHIDPPSASWWNGSHHTWRAPTGTSLALCADSRVSLAVVFAYLHATGHYDVVLRSQGCPPRKPVLCHVYTDGGGLALDEQYGLQEGTREASRELFVAACERLQKLVPINGLDGGILQE